MASYRYRAVIPAKNLGAKINSLDADVLVFVKPMDGDLEVARSHSGKVILDLCDDHLDKPLYKELLHYADRITCTTEKMREIILSHGYTAEVIPDTYEFDDAPTHMNGDKLIWFGHAVNFYSLTNVFDQLNGYPLTIVSNIQGAVPWSVENNIKELDKADIAIFPKTADYKSPNRVFESIRRGCFSVAEPHPALADIPVYQGNIREGIEWAIQNQEEANQMTQRAKDYIIKRYSPKTQADAWRKILASV